MTCETKDICIAWDVLKVNQKETMKAKHMEPINLEKNVKKIVASSIWKVVKNKFHNILTWEFAKSVQSFPIKELKSSKALWYDQHKCPRTESRANISSVASSYWNICLDITSHKLWIPQFFIIAAWPLSQPTLTTAPIWTKKCFNIEMDLNFLPKLSC